MSQAGNFLSYCTERYKSAKGLNGQQVSELFTKYQVWEYVYSCFEALHTTGENYIIEDIDLYIDARRSGTTDEDIRNISKRLIEKNRKAYGELAK